MKPAGLLPTLSTRRYKAADENSGSLFDSAAATAIRFVSIPDGLAADDDRSDSAKLCWSMLRNAPALLEKTIQDISSLEGNSGICMHNC